MVSTLSIVGCALAALIFVVSSLSKRVIFRCIPSLSLRIPFDYEVTRLASLLMQVLAVGVATILVLN